MSTSDGAKIFLSEHVGDPSAGGPTYLVTRDVDAIAAVLELQAQKMPWGKRECATTDPDGNYVPFSPPAD